jgi:hypothetical protein
VALIILAASSATRWPIRTFGQMIRTPDDEVTQLLERYRRLAAYLPGKCRIGYLAPTDEGETRKVLPTARLELLQYALAPRMIDKFTDQENVILDSDEPDARPSEAVRRDWELMADLHDGIKLYRAPRRP